jgi:hypothetical protein
MNENTFQKEENQRIENRPDNYNFKVSNFPEESSEDTKIAITIKRFAEHNQSTKEKTLTFLGTEDIELKLSLLCNTVHYSRIPEELKKYYTEKETKGKTMLPE